MSRICASGDRSLAMEIMVAAMAGLFDRTEGALEWLLFDHRASHQTGVEAEFDRPA